MANDDASDVPIADNVGACLLILLVVVIAAEWGRACTTVATIAHGTEEASARPSDRRIVTI